MLTAHRNDDRAREGALPNKSSLWRIIDGYLEHGMYKISVQKLQDLANIL